MSSPTPNSTPFWTWLAQQQVEHHDMTLRQVSLRAGLSVSTLYQRRMHGGAPSPTTCRKLAALFRFDEDYVLALAGHRLAAPNYDLRQILRALYPQVPVQRIDRALGALQYMLAGEDQHPDPPVVHPTIGESHEHPCNPA